MTKNNIKDKGFNYFINSLKNQNLQEIYANLNNNCVENINFFNDLKMKKIIFKLDNNFIKKRS